MPRFASIFSAFALVPFGTGCGGGVGGNVASMQNHRDASSSVHFPRGDGGYDGCTVTNVELRDLPDQLDGFGSPKQSVAKIAGNWVNNAGDTLDVQPSASGVFHDSEGNRIYSGAGAPVPCSEDSYLGVNAQVALSTRDGHFNELMDVELRFAGNYALFKTDVPLDSLKGTFRANEPNDGVLHWSATFAEGWTLSGSVNITVQQPSSGGAATGAGQVVNLVTFATRVTPADAGRDQ